MRALGLFALVSLAACGAGSTSPAASDAAYDTVADASGEVGDGGGGDSAVEAGGSHATCSFNADCPASERCACSDTTGCFCETGARGAGACGVDACSSGNDCASAVCVEGPAGAFVCSCACSGNADCGGALPLCTAIAYVGTICVRQP